jgi:hypothetical protein
VRPTLVILFDNVRPILLSSISGNNWEDFQLIRDYFSAFANHPRSFRHPNSQAVVVSTFSGENSTFARGNMEEGWKFVKRELSAIAPVPFILFGTRSQ